MTSNETTTGARIRDFCRAALVVVIWTGVLEASLHLAGIKVDGSFYIHDDLRRFRFRPSAAAWQLEEGEEYVRVNRLGFRDREREVERTDGVFRIAVLGDSSVAGTQVSQEETFTQVAENLLGRLPAPWFEVFNFGIPNYNLAQQYITLRDEIFSYHPSLVIEAVSLTNAVLNSNRDTCVNDSPYPYFQDRNGKLELYDPAEKSHMASGTETWLLDIGNKFDIYLLGLKAKRGAMELESGILQKLRVAKPLPEHFYERSLYPPRDAAVEQAWIITEKTLTAMRDLCQSRGVPFWIATMDIPGQVHPDPRAREQERIRIGTPNLHYADDRLATFANRQGIPVIQASPQMAGYAQRTGEYLHGFANTPPNYGHLNRAGHRVLGTIIAERIAEEAPKMLPKL